ncbi:hypothetical protein pdam_00003666, partial [Pocillopora damicornis]
MARKICTPFCIKGKPCLKYHDFLSAHISGTNAGKWTNLKKPLSFLKKGWKTEEEIPDPVSKKAYKVKLSFDPTVCLSLTQETALHRCILYLHYSKITRLSYKTKIMIHLLKDCLHLQDEALQTLLHTAAIKLG